MANTSYIEALRAKAAAAQAKKENKFSSKYNFKPNDGKNVVRILPYPFQEERLPFIEVWFHYGLGKHRSFVCPKGTFGKDCPLCETLEGYRRIGYDKQRSDAEFYRMSYQAHRSKARVYSPIIVRGSESEGVKFWGYAQLGVYEKQLEGFYLDEDYAGMLDEYEGRDLKLTYSKPEGGRNEYATTTVVPAPNASPALPKPAGKKEIEALINSIPNIWNSFLTEKTSEEIQAIIDDLMDDSGMLIINGDVKEDSAEIVKGNTKADDNADSADVAVAVATKPIRKTTARTELVAEDIDKVLQGLDDNE